MKKSTEQQQRIVLLNHLVSRSSTRAPASVTPPRLAVLPFFQDLRKRCEKGVAIEFERLTEKDGMDELARITAGRGHNLLRLRRMNIEEPTKEAPGYAVMLFELLDHQRKSFPVAHIENFKGRELSGEDLETGGLSAHVMVRLPPTGAFDDGVYRCVVESVPSITRARIEAFMCRQIRRTGEWTFKAEGTKGKKTVMKEYAYTPRLELHADVARALSAGSAGGRVLSQLIFTKRAEKRSIAEKVDVKDRDFYADVEIKVSAKQGPEDEVEKATWFSRVRSHFETMGYSTKVYFRHGTGSQVGGDVRHHQIEGAQDLLIMPQRVHHTGGDAPTVGRSNRHTHR